MRLLWHIVRKDARWLAAPGGLWLAFVVLSTTGFRFAHVPVGAADDLANAHGWPEVFGSAALAAAGIQYLTLYVLVGALMLEDAHVGTTAFWLVRPISRVRMLTAKLAVTLIACTVVPTVTLAVFWLLNGASIHDVLTGLVPQTWDSVVVIVASVVLASTVQRLATFLLVSLAVGVGWSASALCLEWLTRPRGFMLDAHPNPVLWRTVPAVVGATLLARLIFRHRGWVWGTLAAALAVGVCLQRVKPWESAFDGPPARVEDVSVDCVTWQIGANDRLATCWVDGTAKRDVNGTFRVPVIGFLPSRRNDSAVLAHAEVARRLAENPSTARLSWRLALFARRDAPQPNIGRGFDAICADLFVVGETAVTAQTEIRHGARRLRILATTQTRDGVTVLLEQHDFAADDGDRWPPRVHDAFVWVDRKGGRSGVLMPNRVGTAYLNGQRLEVFQLLLPASAGESAAIVQVRFRSDRPLHFSNSADDTAAQP